MKSFAVVLIALICSGNLLFAQKKAEKVKIQLKKDVQYLSSDELEGRLSGSSGEYKAALYIADAFKMAGLLPKGDNNTYFQDISVVQIRINQNKVPLMVKDKGRRLMLLIPQVGDFYPISYSCNNDSLSEHPTVFVNYGISAPDLNLNDYKDTQNLRGKVFIIKLGSPEVGKEKNRFSVYENLALKVDLAIKYGARGVVFIKADSLSIEPSGMLDRNIQPRKIPVVYAKKHSDFIANCHSITLVVKIAQLNSTGRNVVGFIDNKKKETIVITAHHDHLGYNEYGGSLDTKSGVILPGADDNASGVAMMLQLMRKIKKSCKYKKANYLFVSFTGSEQENVGAHFFVNNTIIDFKTIKYNINLDRVGRLDSTTRNLMILGTESNNNWKASIEKIKTKPENLTLSYANAYIIKSDDVVFTQMQKPSLSFYTGINPQYHTSMDVESLINYTGMYWTQDFILKLIKKTQKQSFIKN